ncbi:MAG: hypothetical protein M0Z32_09065 [Actinomycetota bacterium]|nr:hypothetical protein [Actinomycetota bacterium]
MLKAILQLRINVFGKLNRFETILDELFDFAFSNVLLFTAIFAILSQAVKIRVLVFHSVFDHHRGHFRTTLSAINSSPEIMRVFPFAFSRLIPDLYNFLNSIPQVFGNNRLMNSLRFNLIPSDYAFIKGICEHIGYARFMDFPRRSLRGTFASEPECEKLFFKLLEGIVAYGIKLKCFLYKGGSFLIDFNGAE